MMNYKICPIKDAFSRLFSHKKITTPVENAVKAVESYTEADTKRAIQLGMSTVDYLKLRELINHTNKSTVSNPNDIIEMAKTAPKQECVTNMPIKLCGGIRWKQDKYEEGPYQFYRSNYNASVLSISQTLPKTGHYSKTKNFKHGAMGKVLSNGDIVMITPIGKYKNKISRRVYRDGILIIDDIKQVTVKEVNGRKHRVVERHTDYNYPKDKDGIQITVKGRHLVKESFEAEFKGIKGNYRRVKIEPGTVYTTKFDTWPNTHKYIYNPLIVESFKAGNGKSYTRYIDITSDGRRKSCILFDNGYIESKFINGKYVDYHYGNKLLSRKNYNDKGLPIPSLAIHPNQVTDMSLKEMIEYARRNSDKIKEAEKKLNTPTKVQKTEEVQRNEQLNALSYYGYPN